MKAAIVIDTLKNLEQTFGMTLNYRNLKVLNKNVGVSVEVDSVEEMTTLSTAVVSAGYSLDCLRIQATVRVSRLLRDPMAATVKVCSVL